VWQEIQTIVFICKCSDMRHNTDMLVELTEFAASICFPFNSILPGYHQLAIRDFKLAQFFHYMSKAEGFAKVEGFAKFRYWDRDNFVKSRCKTHSKFLAQCNKILNTFICLSSISSICCLLLPIFHLCGFVDNQPAR
jgi:hypothetical protein